MVAARRPGANWRLIHSSRGGDQVTFAQEDVAGVVDLVGVGVGVRVAAAVVGLGADGMAGHFALAALAGEASGQDVDVVGARAFLAALGAGCRCQEPRPCWSSRMLVLVQDAAEAVASVDVEMGEPVGFGDRFGQGTEWCGACESAVGPVLLVEELLVLAQRVE